MNLLLPFRRGPRDFAAGEGEVLLRSMLEQVLGTELGEVPWRTAFGVGLEGLRHGTNGAVLAELVRLRVREAMHDWLPQAGVIECHAVRAEAVLRVCVVVRLRDSLLPWSLDLPAPAALGTS